MAITATARGTGGNNTGATSIACTPASNFAANSFAVLILAYDNAGSGGSDPFSSIYDSVSNQWTSRTRALYDPGAANAGVTLGAFTSPMATSKLTTSDSVTVSFGSTSVTSKAFAFWEVLPTSSSYYIEYGTGANGTGSATNAPTVTTSSITSGYIVIGNGGSESADTWVGDSDATNGTWSTKQSKGYGTGTSGMSVVTQYKVPSGTGTQTYNPTQTSADCILNWISLYEVALPLFAGGAPFIGGGFF